MTRRPRPRRQPRRHRQPAPHRPPLRHPRHPRLADLRRLAGPRHDHPPADLLRLAEAGLDGGRAARRRPDGRGPADLRDRAASSSHSCDETEAVQPDPDAARAAGLRRRAERRQGQGLVPARLQPAPGAAGDRAGQARGADRDRVLQPLRLQRAWASRVHQGGRRPRDRAPAGSACAACSRPLDRQRLRGRRPRGRRQGLFINVLEALQTGHYFRTGPCPEPGPGRGDGARSARRAELPRRVLPGATPLLRRPMPDYPPGPSATRRA